jgi:septal ring factor EnvC (AmiA/AmiB activator)
MLAENTKKMEAKQQELQTRFRDIEDKLGTVVKMFKSSNTTQVQMQETLMAQQAQLSKIGQMIERIADDMNTGGDESGSPSPTRKQATIIKDQRARRG